ncbi:MAG TPA: hypothetical protein VFP21_11380, partial [Solirubrobacterales bacterium]|nr:hypothetical protein [Solirubrobacterales bacterium]
DARADVYALGCLLFKLLTGEVPFPREGEAARLYAHLHDPPPAPSLYVPAVPMALDDVVIRAMSKLPDDRYPSAGDLGRAAQAALSGTAVSVPERTVATGAAATRETPTPTEATRKLSEESAKQGGRRLLIGGGILVLLVVAVVAVVLAAGGGGDGAPAASGGTTTTKAHKEAPEKQKPEKRSQPPSLSATALIKKGDEICTDSQETYKSYVEEFPSGEEEANVAYSRLLAGISGKAMRRFEELKPPVSAATAYAAYVKSQREVARWDRDALKAAEEEDLSAYLAAREKRDATAPERKELAEDVGFHVCSGSEA